MTDDETTYLRYRKAFDLAVKAETGMTLSNDEVVWLWNYIEQLRLHNRALRYSVNELKADNERLEHYRELKEDFPWPPPW